MRFRGVVLQHEVVVADVYQHAGLIEVEIGEDKFGADHFADLQSKISRYVARVHHGRRPGTL